MSVVQHLNDSGQNDDQSILCIEVNGDKEDNELQILQHVDGEKCMSIIDGENVCLQSPSSQCDGKSFVVKVPRANSKLILQNMEEVLNSVKKKHRQKHRRKKEQKKLAMLAEAEAEQRRVLKTATPNTDSFLTSLSSLSSSSSSSTTSVKDTATATSKDISKNSGKKLIKKPLQEQQALQDQVIQSNHIGRGKHHSSKRRKGSISPLKSSATAEKNTSSNSLLHHLVRTPKKNQEECNDGIQRAVHENASVPQISKPSTNAFEVMMNARNKTIGSNTPGKESNIDDESSNNTNLVNAKRKLMLQSWSDRKGGLKRKMDEEMRAAYVEECLEERAKRLKKMLMSDGSPCGTRKNVRNNTSEMDSVIEQMKSSSSYKKPKQRSKISSRRSRRLSSSDSEASNMERSETLDTETAEFLSKLSSPTKKRDSLLGYFTKIPSPNESTPKTSSTSTPHCNEKNQHRSIKVELDTPKSRGRSKSAKQKGADIEEKKNIKNSEYVEKSPPSGTPTLRPKRACADKAKYDYDLEGDDSPKKDQKVDNADKHRRNKRKQRQNSIAANDVDDILIIDLDSSTSFNVPNETKSPKKLAPLFMRSVPKPSPDLETLKARQEFLRSGVPDKLKLEQEKQKQYDQNYEEAIQLFPKISHLQQWSNDDEMFLTQIPSKSKSFRLIETEELLSFDNSTEANCRINNNSRKGKATKGRSSLMGITSCGIRDFRFDRKLSKIGETSQVLSSGNLVIVSNKRQIIKSWKSEFERFPTYKCYNQLRTKYRFFSVLDSAQDTEQVTESFVVTRSTRRSLDVSSMSSSTQEEDIKPPDTAPNGELLFTEKYKPMLFEQVLVNLTPVSQLRDFLANWVNGNGGGSARNSQNLDDSMDFINDSNSSQQATCNSVVLLGPASSGKTNAVFTLANEMNFNVLEINAGMKRTGKKLIQELLEATQSHQIRNESRGGSAVKSKAQKNLLKMSLNSMKERKKTSVNSGYCEVESPTVTDLNVRKCIILIEDADIIFDQTDAGFTDAVYTLAASSKRPVIVIATNPNCQHLQRLMAQNTIKFTAPNALSISKYLAVLSLMENCPVSLDDLISLYLYNRHDLRKTLHELQFFIQSGGDHKRQVVNAGSFLGALEQSIHKQEKTPQKESEQSELPVTGQYFASPGKRRLSEDIQSLNSAVSDEQLKRETHQQQQQQSQSQSQSTEEELYMHRSLFEFYTVDQNAKWRVPFPVKFDLLHVNLSDIFAIAKKLKPQKDTSAAKASATSKRKTRSPKKVWLSTATANTADVTEKSRNSEILESLNTLSCFYNNVSVATLVAERNECFSYAAKDTQQDRDRLKPYLSESIAHDILENAINVNLEAEVCPYNLFESEKKGSTLCGLMGPTMAMLPKRIRSVDLEPALRTICRSEQQRSALERRSSRFYHYLRNSCVDTCNFSQRPFDTVCSVFQDQQPDIEYQTMEQEQNRTALETIQ